MMNGNGPEPAPIPPQRTYDGSIQVSIQLPLASWGIVLNMLAEAPAPWKTTDLLIKGINEQIQTALRDVEPTNVQQQPLPAP